MKAGQSPGKPHEPVLEPNHRADWQAPGGYGKKEGGLKAVTMRKTKFLIVLSLALAPTLILAGDDASDWARTKKTDRIEPYNDYVINHPQGAHLREAYLRAGELSAALVKKAASSCDPLFPRMVYYAVAATDQVTVTSDVLASSLEKAAALCDYSRILVAQDQRYAAAGMIEADRVMMEKMEGKLPPQTFIDLHALLIDLEDSVVLDAQQEIVKCSDQSAWVDTPMKDQVQCQAPHRQAQNMMVEGMAEQMSYDLAHIHMVQDIKYRKKFWERYQRLAGSEVVKQVAVINKMRLKVRRAWVQEQDPGIKESIMYLENIYREAEKQMEPY